MNNLQTDGVVVVQLMTLAETEAHRKAVLDAVKAAPELNHAGENPASQALGSFGALGTPSSQNNVAVRNLRKLAHLRTVKTVWRAIAGGRNLEQLVDRLCVRTQKQPKEYALFLILLYFFSPSFPFIFFLSSLDLYFFFNV